MDLRQTVEMAKPILTKEKIDRQLTGQTSLTPFMNIKGGLGKKVTFNMMDGIEQMIDKLTVMMDKLVMEDNGQNRQFKLCVYQSNRGRGQTRPSMIREDFRTGIDQTMPVEDDRGKDKKIEVGNRYDNPIIEVATVIT